MKPLKIDPAPAYGPIAAQTRWCVAFREVLYMTGEGLLSAGLAYAIQRIRQWKHASLPVALSPEDLAKVLAVPHQRTV